MCGEEPKCRQGQILKSLQVPGKGVSLYHQKCQAVKGLGLCHCLLSEDWRMQAGSGRQETAKVQ